MIDAKCPKCSNRARVNDDMTNVECKYCGYSDSYENYLEVMQTRAENMSDNFQFKGNI